jgi:hypothetical protein
VTTIGFVSPEVALAAEPETCRPLPGERTVETSPARPRVEGILLSGLLPRAVLVARGDLKTLVLEELDAILGHPWPDVVLVDDARCLGQGDYPSIDGIRAIVAGRRPDWSVSVANDIIRIHGLARLGPTK